jgi:hypothetical protein
MLYNDSLVEEFMRRKYVDKRWYLEPATKANNNVELRNDMGSAFSASGGAKMSSGVADLLSGDGWTSWSSSSSTATTTGSIKHNQDDDDFADFQTAPPPIQASILPTAPPTPVTPTAFPTATHTVLSNSLLDGFTPDFSSLSLASTQHQSTSNQPIHQQQHQSMHNSFVTKLPAYPTTSTINSTASTDLFSNSDAFSDYKSAPPAPSQSYPQASFPQLSFNTTTTMGSHHPTSTHFTTSTSTLHHDPSDPYAALRNLTSPSSSSNSGIHQINNPANSTSSGSASLAQNLKSFNTHPRAMMSTTADSSGGAQKASGGSAVSKAKVDSAFAGLDLDFKKSILKNSTNKNSVGNGLAGTNGVSVRGFGNTANTGGKVDTGMKSTSSTIDDLLGLGF